MKKRVLSFLLAFAMVLPYLAMGVPAVSAASGVLVIADLDAPTAGQAPDYTVTLGEGYSLDSLDWWYYDPAEQSVELMLDGDTFQENTYYECRILVAVEDGIYPDGAQVVGATHVEEGYGSDMMSVFAGYANGCEAITHIDVFGIPETIEAGQAPSFDQYINDSRYDVVSTWTDSDNNELEAGEVFAANEDYELRVNFYPKAGYYFEESASIFTPIDVDGMLAGGAEAFVRKEYTTKQFVNEAFVQSNQPVAGGVAADVSFTVPEDANYQINQVTWFLYSNETGMRSLMEEGATFLSGKIYEAEVEVTMKGEYAFDASQMTLQYNGEEKQYHSLDSNCFWFDATFSVDTQVVDVVDITGVPLAVYDGGTPTWSIASPEPEKYRFVTTWLDEDGEELTENTTFQMGNSYTLYMEVLPQEGYSFAEDTGVSITAGGNVLNQTYYYFKEAWGYIEVGYDLYELVGHVEVTGLSEPVVGQKLDFEVEIPADAAYEVYQVVWYRYNYDLGHDERLEEDFVVTDGNCYFCVLEIYPVDSRFNDALTVSLNGAAYEDISYNSNYVDVYAEYNLGLEVIDEVDLSNLPTAVEPGDVLNRIDVSLEPEKYTVEAYWTDSEMGELEDGAVAQIGQHYDLEFEIYPKEGYAFSDDTVAIYDAANSTFDYDYYDFDDFYGSGYFGFNVYHRIQRVDLLNVTTPVAGQTATTAGITVPADADYALKAAYWMNYEGEEFTGKFASGQHYTLMVELTCDENIQVDYCPVYVNGKYSFGTADGGSGSGIIYCWLEYYVSAEDIFLVELTDVPTISSRGWALTDPSLVKVPANAPYSVTAINWVKYLNQENKVEIVNDDKFVDGNIYAMLVTLAPDAGYQFCEPDVLVEGKENSNFTVNEDGSLTVVVEYPLSRAISELHINGVTDPVLGQYASTSGITVTESSKVDVLKVWIDPETEDFENGFTGRFVENEYMLIVAAYPKSGYHFAEDLKVYVNGELYPDAIVEGYTVAGVQMYYDLRAKTDRVLDRVDITVDTPQPGKVVGPAVAEVPDGAKYKISWIDQSLYEGETYLDDEEYYINLELQPLDGYEFAEDLKIYVNGAPVDPESIQYQGSYDVGVYMQYFFGEEITKVEIDQVADAVVGERAPQYDWMENNSTEQYEVYCEWYVWNPNMGYWAEFYGTFEEGFYYRRCLRVLPRNGCYFAEDVAVTVNGEPVAVVIGSRNSLEDMNTYYNFGAQVRDTIVVTGASLPEIDGKADASTVKLAPGSGCQMELAAWFASPEKDLNLDTWEPTETFQTGKYHALVLAVRRKNDIPFDSELTVVIDGVEHTDCMVYLYDDYVIVAVPFGKLYSGDSLLGDLNGDDEVTSADVEALLMHSLYPEDFPVEADVDYSGDGKVTSRDVEMLLMYFLYPEDFPLA